MEDRPPIVCLCGSTKFKNEFEEMNKQFTLHGYIVVIPGVFIHAGDTISDEEKVKLDALHKEKIKLSDMVFVIDKDKYIGSSTRSEIEFAKVNHKPVIYYSEVIENVN